MIAPSDLDMGRCGSRSVHLGCQSLRAHDPMVIEGGTCRWRQSELLLGVRRYRMASCGVGFAMLVPQITQYRQQLSPI